jgi:hypothetical protein
MRLPEAKIKEAILHPEKLVRQEALLYFAGCYSRDAEVMPLAIRAIDTYGRAQAFPRVYLLPQLAQTEATVEWGVRELHREEDRAEDEDSYFPALSRLLCSADLRLVAPRAEEVLRAPGFSTELVPEFRERLRLASWDADQCWKELERICAEAVGKEDSSDVDWDHAGRVVEALACQGAGSADHILDLLGQEVEDFETDPMAWLEIFLVTLAGELRLQRAIPLIVKKLHACGDVLSEECVEALAKIGTDEAAEAVAEGWLQAEWDYRLYATDALEKIHSDTTVRKCLELLPRDPDLDIRTHLADGLLGQFADEGIEPVRVMVQRRAYDQTISNLMERLVTVSTVLGVTFAEYPIWKRRAEEEQARLERRMKAMRSSWQAPAEPTPPPAPPAAPDEFPERKPAPFLRTEKPVGRNEPCPCGSGKKFKKCCMNRGKG